MKKPASNLNSNKDSNSSKKSNTRTGSANGSIAGSTKGSPANSNNNSPGDSPDNSPANSKANSRGRSQAGSSAKSSKNSSKNSSAKSVGSAGSVVSKEPKAQNRGARHTGKKNSLKDYDAFEDKNPIVMQIRSQLDNVLQKEPQKRLPMLDKVQEWVGKLEEHYGFWDEVLLLCRIRTMALLDMDYSEIFDQWKKRYCDTRAKKLGAYMETMVGEMMRFESLKPKFPKDCDVRDPYNTPLEMCVFYESEARQMLDSISKARRKCSGVQIPKDLETMYFWLEAISMFCSMDTIKSMEAVQEAFKACDYLPHNFFVNSWMYYVYGPVPAIAITKDYLYRYTLSEVSPMDELANLYLWSIYLNMDKSEDEQEIINGFRDELKKGPYLTDVLLSEGIYHLFDDNFADARYCFDNAILNSRISNRRQLRDKIAVFYATHYDFVNSEDANQGNIKELKAGMDLLLPNPLKGLQRNFLYCRGLYYYNKDNWKRALNYLLPTSNIKLGVDRYTPFLGHVCSFIGTCYDNSGDTEKGSQYHLRAAKIYSGYEGMENQVAQEYFAASRIWAEGFDNPERRKYLMKAYDLVKDDPQITVYGYVMIAMGKISMSEDKYEEAESYLLKSREFYKDHSNAYNAHEYLRGTILNLADCYIALDSDARAENMFTQAWNMDSRAKDISGMVEDMVLLGKHRRKMEKFEGALEALDKALEILASPKAKKAYSITDWTIERMLALREKGNLLFTLERINESVETFRKIVDIFNSEINEDMYRQDPMARQTMFHLLNETAVVMRVGVGDTALAEDLIKRFGEKFADDNPEMRTMLNITLSQVYKDAGEMEKAEDATINVIRQLENDPNVTNDLKAMFYNDLGMIMGKMDKPHEAEGAFGQALDILGAPAEEGEAKDPVTKVILQVTYLHNRARSLREQGNLIEAEKLSWEILEKMQTSGMFTKTDMLQVKMEIIELEVLQRNHSTAKEMAEEALKGLSRTDSNRCSLYIMLSIINKSLGDYNTANKYLKDYLTFVKRWKNDDICQKAEIYRELALNYMDMEKPDESLEYLLKCEEIYDIAQGNPGGRTLGKSFLLSVYGLHGRYFISKGMEEKAIEYLEKALDIADSIPGLYKMAYANLYDFIGQCYFNLRNFDKAEHYYRLTLENTSDEYTIFRSDVMGNLMYTLDLMGRKEEAEQLALDRIMILESSGASRQNLAVAYKYWAILILSKDRDDECEKGFSVVEDLLNGIEGEHRLKSDMFYEIGMAMCNLEKNKGGRHYLTRAIQEMEHLSDIELYRKRRGESIFMIAESYIADELEDKAIDFLHKTLDTLDKNDNQGASQIGEYMINVLNSLTKALFSIENYQEALQVHERMLKLCEEEYPEWLPVEIKAQHYDFHGELQSLNDLKNEAMASFVKALKLLEGVEGQDELRRTITQHLTDI